MCTLHKRETHGENDKKTFKFEFSEPCTDEPNRLRELAHRQTYSSEAVYSERRINEQLCCEWRHGLDVVLVTILGHKA